MNLGEQTGQMIELEPTDEAPAAVEADLRQYATKEALGEDFPTKPVLVGHVKLGGVNAER